MEEKKREILEGDYLTVEEAKINNLNTQKIDFENPTKDLVSGLPGFVRPKERARQLEVIKNCHLKNVINAEKLMKENNNADLNRSKRFRISKPKKELEYKGD